MYNKPQPFGNNSASEDSTIRSVRLYYNPSTGNHIKKDQSRFFIAGPIPFQWAQKANSLPGKAGAVGLSLWFLKGLKRSFSFAVTAKAVELSGCSRQAFSRGLAALAKAKLISVHARSGARPIVEIFPEERAELCQSSTVSKLV